jgi:hypothetical protein
MKLSTVATTVLLAASPAAAQFKAMLALLKTFKLTAPLECAMPCILSAADKLPLVDGVGPASAICSNVNWIAETARECTKECNSDKANGTYPRLPLLTSRGTNKAADVTLIDFAVELANWVCGHGKKEEAKVIEDSAEGERAKEL